MPYVKVGPFTNGSVTPPIDKTFLDGVETALSDALLVLAPAPSGGDDTATLQALVNTAQSTGGTVQLRAGTYKANLVTAATFFQPRILGRGKQYTFVQAFDGSKPVIQFVGSSGSVTSGEVSALAVTGTTTSTTAPTGTGIEIVGADGVKLDVEFRYLQYGVVFHNRDTGMFTEFCVAENCVWTYVITAVRYRVTSGNESFHGSGVRNGVMGTVTGGTGPMIQIDAGAFPYNAPLDTTIFSNTANTNLIVNNSTTRQASFVGNLRMELQNADPTVVASTAGANVYFAGEVTALGGTARLGKLYLVDRLNYSGSNTFPSLKPLERSTTLAAGTTNVLAEPMIGGAFYICTLTIYHPTNGYYYSYSLIARQSAFNSSGAITQLSNPDAAAGTSGIGAPTLGWNNGLTVANAGFTSAYIANASLVQLGTIVASSGALGQY